MHLTFYLLEKKPKRSQLTSDRNNMNMADATGFLLQSTLPFKFTLINCIREVQRHSPTYLSHMNSHEMYNHKLSIQVKHSGPEQIAGSACFLRKIFVITAVKTLNHSVISYR